MKNLPLIVGLLLTTIFFCQCTSKEKTDNATTNTSSVTPPEKAEYAMVIHGGAGTVRKSEMSDEREKQYNDALNTALDIGEAILKKGGSSLDAVEQTLRFLEDSPLFNSGKGSVFTFEGKNELDASIMEGKDKMAGAVGGVTNIKNPISAARAVMEKSKHVLLTGKGAETFAIEQGMETVEPEYFYTEERIKALKNVKKAAEENKAPSEKEKHGTVGCVALDKSGTISAGTSTGGMTNKRWNRLGDSPIIGAGTYADNNTCGISCTGHGEFFIRYAVAYDIAAMIEYKGVSIKEASDEVIHNKLLKVGGAGGVVGLDKYGNIAMHFNTEGMYRGYAKPNERVVKMYKE